MFNLSDVGRMASTLVETVSIDYEDFNDSFLTCGTCLCMYDGAEHHPKLLPCSHTVCKNCLERIHQASRDTTMIRCPICRENIPMPRGGVGSFPPSFLVNQLLDLMARQRRDIIPKCLQHPQQELMFCETCDTVFCISCTGGSHNGRGSSAHTVIPFSIAIKRMSEILLYKASLCMSNLNTASDVVTKEIRKVEENAEMCIESISKNFEDVINTIDKRRHDVINMVRKVCDDKKKVLKEQLDIIESEKSKVQRDCEGLQQQVEVRNISKKISDLNEMLEVSSTLSEPRENAFVKFEYKHNTSCTDLMKALHHFGRIRISKTYPALCMATIDKAVTNLKTTVTVTTVDYHGNPRITGSDPLSVELHDEDGEVLSACIKDHDNGTYTITYTPRAAGQHKMTICIFERAIRDSPFTVEVSEHNNPLLKLGSHGMNNSQFIQPIHVVTDSEHNHYVLDTGNSRIKVIDQDFRFIKHIGTFGLEEHSATGLALAPNNHLIVSNWRTRNITKINQDGDVVKKFTSGELLEPVCVACNRHGEVLVADNGVGKIFVFDSNGRKLNVIGCKGDQPGQLKLISAIYVCPNDDILVTDHRLQIFNRSGVFLRELTTESGVRGQFGGVTMDNQGRILATRQEKGKFFVQVFNASGRALFMIDSYGDKLKRASGLSCTHDGHVVVVDLGNDCIKKYRYL